MTIKELCDNTPKCSNCPFQGTCDTLNCNVPWSMNEDMNISVTKSIIETAKLLLEDNNG